MFVFTEQGIRQQREMLAKGFKPYAAEGHAAESPANRDRPAVNPDESAVGHPGALGAQRVMPDEDAEWDAWVDSWPDDARKAAPGRHPQTGRFRGELAVGHGIDGGQMSYQPSLTPVPAARLASSTGGEGALASSIAMHQGMAQVHRFDAASAASPGLAAQLGHNAPSGIPGQPPIHVAPTGVGSQFRVSPSRGGI